MSAEDPAPVAALKEWAAVEALLASGDVSLLIRKGGLIERRGEFEVEHRRFWLFPTQYHQNPPELRPDFHWALEAARDSRPREGRLPLRLLLDVEAAFRIEDEALLPEIAPLQPYTDEVLHSRFHYRGRPYLHALLVRAFVREEPYPIRRRPSSRGCVSWVPLEEEVPEEGLRPVLDEEEFATVRRELLGRVGETTGATPA